MTTKQLNYKALPVIAAADGATSPALTASDKGAMAWSTITNKPMSWDGTKWNLLTKVDSVAGRTGAVTLTKTDVGLGSVDDVSAASLRDRTTHTGVQAISSVTGLQTALDGKAAAGHSHSEATTAAAGFMSSADKTKLNSIDSVALLNRVNHTGAQAISTITGLQTAIDGKASTGHAHSEATTSAGGFMSSADKTKLDALNSATLLDRANHTGAQAIVTVTGLQGALDTKAATTHTHANASTTVPGFMSDVDKTKLDGISAGATAYVHPANHPASIITQDASNRFVTDAEKAAWGAKQPAGTYATGTGTASGTNTGDQTTITGNAGSATTLSTGADRTKLDGIAAGANNYAHPANHPASVITQDASNRFVTDAEKAAWNAKAEAAHTHAAATTAVAGFMSNTDKTKLDGIAVGANNFTYAHPANHPASVITQDGNNRFVTDGEKATWNAKIGSVKTINGQSIVGSGDLVLAASSTFATDITVNGNRFGKGAGAVLTNTASGSSALNANTFGDKNTASGFGALQDNTTGGDNTATGALALQRNTTGVRNTATGVSALAKNISGNNNTAYGCLALSVSTTSGENTAFGAFALSSNTSGANNTATGVSALSQNTTGYSNTATGQSAMNANQTGGQNTAYGTIALRSNTTGNNNAATGCYALQNNTTGGNNTADGAYALQLNTIGTHNTATGYFAMQNNSAGSYNTAYGAGALQSNSTGAGNTVIGSQFTTSGAYAPIINPSTENNLVVMGSTAVTNAYIKVAWTVVSDARDKTNFKAIPHGLDFVKQLKPTAYQFRESRESEETNGGVRYGFKAQDIAAIEPEAVIVDTTNPEKLYYNESNLIPILVKAIQELSAEVERLKNANPNY
jgi:hypothetical protein